MIPADPWDVPMDGFASPEGLSWFSADAAEPSGRKLAGHLAIILLLIVVWAAFVASLATHSSANGRSSFRLRSTWSWE